MQIVEIATSPGFSLAQTVAPVAWGGGRWPNQDWIQGAAILVSADRAGHIIRHVTSAQSDASLLVFRTNRPELDHQDWTDRVLGARRIAPAIADPVIAAIAARYSGMRPFSNGDLFDGIVTAIVGQSISVQAAAVTERKLAALFREPIEYGDRQYWPSPSAEQLANADPAYVRLAGVTQRRANAIVAIAKLAVNGQLAPALDDASDEHLIYESVLRLPQVGRWTAESVLLWGLGADDAYPVGDVALLRAARLAYGRPEMTHTEMNSLSDGWRPGRSWAARWLWINLFGPAPDASPAGEPNPILS